MIKRGDETDILVLAKLAALMWESHSIGELAEDMAEIMAREDAQFFIKYEDEIPIGFAQCQLRHDYVEGTETSPVGYLEGILVRADYRRRGYARELLQECEKWAREKGCREFASDCELVNEESLRFHMAVGFCEANRIICFTKKL